MNWIEAIKNYKACNEQEQKDKELAVNCLEVFDDVLTRDNGIAHVTSSAFVVNKKRDKVLMVYHNIFDSWSLTGGHADGDGDLLSVAVREAMEETGVEHIYPVSEEIVSLDILSVLGHTRKGKYVPPHLHISIVYLLEADESERLIVKPDENSGVQWVPIKEIDKYSNEPHMIKVYNKIAWKIGALNIKNGG